MLAATLRLGANDLGRRFATDRRSGCCIYFAAICVELDLIRGQTFELTQKLVLDNDVAKVRSLAVIDNGRSVHRAVHGNSDGHCNWPLVTFGFAYAGDPDQLTVFASFVDTIFQRLEVSGGKNVGQRIKDLVLGSR